ncbi:hypothetical protein C8J56DRAFT_917481 [Mycena floridula]|nr:hypothetical protein C8J56DRAFT_917481 [Mycena floridula]
MLVFSSCSLPLYLLAGLQFSTTALGSASLTIPTVGTDSLSVTGSATGTAISQSSVSTSASATSSAQFPSLSGYSSCVATCLTETVAAMNCSSIVLVDCYCPEKAFPSDLTSCFKTSCPAELPAAESLVEQFCGLASSSRSISFSITAFPSSSASISTTPTPSNSAAAVISIASPSLLALGASIMGLVMGAIILG